jgi:hypothetical protein
MSFPSVTACYYQKEFFYEQLLILHVAANYKLRGSHVDWFAVGYEWSNNFVRYHHNFVVRPLLRRGLLEGNSRGEKLAMTGRYQTSMEKPMLWISAKGRTLLDKITIETGLVFDEVNYQLIEPGQKVETDGIDLANCYDERKPTAAYDRAISLLNEGEAKCISS